MKLKDILGRWVSRRHELTMLHIIHQHADLQEQPKETWASTVNASIAADTSHTLGTDAIADIEQYIIGNVGSLGIYYVPIEERWVANIRDFAGKFRMKAKADTLPELLAKLDQKIIRKRQDGSHASQDGNGTRQDGNHETQHGNG